MKTILIFHFSIFTLLVVCACSPWLALAALSAVESDLGLAAGYIGMVVTPLGLVVAAVYAVGAVVFHFVYTGLRNAAGKPPMQGYLVTWSALALAGGLVGAALLFIPSMISEMTAIRTPAPGAIKDCAAAMRAPIASPWQNGPIAVGVRLNSPASGQPAEALLILTPDNPADPEYQLLSAARLLPLPHKAHSLSWSPDGTQIVFSDDYNLYLVDADGQAVRLLTDEPLPKDSASQASGPAWAADGQTIYFEKRLPGEAVNLEVFAIQPDGEGLQQLTDTPGYNFSPRPSLDGKQLVFVSSRDGDSEVYLMDADGSRPRRLTIDPAVDSDPAWSPDGQWLAFVSNRSEMAGSETRPYEIHLISRDGAVTCQLTTGDIQPSGLAWSPDGQFILFRSLAADALMAVRPDGSSLYTLFSDASLQIIGAPAWAAQ